MAPGSSDGDAGQAIATIIPTYNRASLLPRAIQSALSQSLPGDLVFVVDDGSSDGTARALADYGDRITSARQKNGGPGAARNRGLDLTHTPLCAFLDSDDEWLPGKLALQRKVMRHRPDVVLCFSDFQVVEAGRTEPHYLERWLKEAPDLRSRLAEDHDFRAPAGVSAARLYVGDIYPLLLECPYVLTSSLMVRRPPPQVRFIEDSRIYEDWDFIARLAATGAVAYLDVDTTIQHAHREGRLTDATHAERAVAALRLRQRIWGRDARFRAQREADYRRVIGVAERRAVRTLLVDGQPGRARQVISETEGPMALERVLSWFPGQLLRALMGVRRAVGRGS